MDGFIKKIFNGVNDELVHAQFQKFSRGVFKQRAIFKASKSAKGFSLVTGNEYATELVRAVAEKLGSGKTNVTGVVVSTLDLKSKLPYSDIKQFMGIKQYVIEGEMAGNDIVKLIDTLPDAFFALTFSFGTTFLKIKPKAPKSAKPKTSDEPPKPDFCSLKTEDESLINQFVIETGWKTLLGEHTYNITDIEVPSNIKDLNEMRRLAKRKGTIIRKCAVDGKEVISEKAFIA